MTNEVKCNVDVLFEEFTALLAKGIAPTIALHRALSVACASPDTALTAGARLRSARILRGKTLRDLTDVVSISHLSQFERGKKHAISERILRNVCRRLNVRYEWVMENELPIEENTAVLDG